MNSKAVTGPNAPPKDTSWLSASFASVQDNLISKMKLSTQSVSHAATMGEVGESHWRDLLRSYLPNRYGVTSGFVIDCNGSRSDQIDIVVFDTQYTPTLLDQQDHRYIPAEAVYAIFECKQTVNLKNIKYAQGKAASVRRLHRTSIPIAHAGGTFPAKTLFPITAGLLAWRSDWEEGLGKSFKKGLAGSADLKLDCGCVLNHGCFDDYDGSLSVKTDAGALMYFLFRLLSKLQSLATVPAVDWVKYSQIIKPK